MSSEQGDSKELDLRSSLTVLFGPGHKTANYAVHEFANSIIEDRSARVMCVPQAKDTFQKAQEEAELLLNHLSKIRGLSLHTTREELEENKTMNPELIAKGKGDIGGNPFTEEETPYDIYSVTARYGHVSIFFAFKPEKQTASLVTIQYSPPSSQENGGK